MGKSAALVAVLLGAFAAPAGAQESAGRPAEAPTAPADAHATSATPADASRALTSDDERAIYAVGISLWRSLAPLELSPAEIDLLIRGLKDARSGSPAIGPDEAAPKVAAFRRARAERAAGKFKADSAAYLDKAAKEKGAVTTASGLVFFDLQPGMGARPGGGDVVSIHYRGTLANGVEFDSSYSRKQPVQLPLGHLVPCFVEGLQLMKAGGKARFVCPAKLGYGDAGAPPRGPRKPAIPGDATLIFDVELYGIVPPPDAASAPSQGRLTP